jgi:hypothetical protein
MPKQVIVAGTPSEAKRSRGVSWKFSLQVSAIQSSLSFLRKQESTTLNRLLSEQHPQIQL